MKSRVFKSFVVIAAFGIGLLVAWILGSPDALSAEPTQAKRPNILWVTCEDISPDLGCYGVPDAVTPTLDRLAAEGIRYENAFALAGVCAVSRSCLITGMYSSTLGSQGMRFHTQLPEHVRCFPEYLRRAGYYCTNNSKTDYNFPVPKEAWDECSGKAHWRNRKPDQPFFAVFNFTTTHESQIRCSEKQYEKHMRRVPKELRRDPAKISVPPFHPDRPEVRENWAQYHDLITAMDLQVRDILEQLEADGLAEETIVFFYGDHGAGMPRCKKWSYDAGTRVPLILRFPKSCSQLAPEPAGTSTDRLVSFVDFAPTVLSLTGLPIPEQMQGHAFAGQKASKPREMIYTIRDRMAERFDMCRGVRTKQFLYLRNYMPHLPHQFASYTEQMPTTQVWQQLAAEGKLSGPPALWFQTPKPREELFDVAADPHQLHNLAADPKHATTLRALRAAHLDWVERTHDLGFLPESDMLVRSEGTTPFAMGRDPKRYPQQRIVAMADLVGMGRQSMPTFLEGLDDPDPAIRYWSAVGLGALGADARSGESQLEATLKDPSPAVRLTAADALLRIGSDVDVLSLAVASLEHESPWIRLRAASLLEQLGEAARPALPAINQALKKKSRFGYENRLFTRLKGNLSK